MKVQGVLKRASLGYEGEQSIMVELKLHNAEAMTHKREAIKFTAAADIDIGGNDTMRIVIEGKGKALNFDSRFSLVRVITFGKAK